MTKNIFREEPVGFVRHTAMSRMLVEQPACFDMVGMLTEEFIPASTGLFDAMNEPGWSVDEPNHTGFNVYHRTDLPVFQELAKTSERVRRFGSGMEFLTSGPEYDVRHMLSQFDPDELDRHDGKALKVVDVGGGNGQIALAMAQATKSAQFIVQDLPGVIEQAQQSTKNKTGRVHFMAHDFFTPQLNIGADVYLLRYILHNWSDKYCLCILRNLLPALKDGVRIFVCEYVLPEPAETSWRLDRYVATRLNDFCCSNPSGSQRSARWIWS